MCHTRERFEQALKDLRRYALSAGDDLLGMEMDFIAYLSGHPKLDSSSVTVTRTSDPDELLAVRCAPGPGVPLPEATEAVLHLWLGTLGYTYSAGHYLESSRDTSVLRFVTQVGPGGYYVTGKVTIFSDEGPV